MRRSTQPTELLSEEFEERSSVRERFRKEGSGEHPAARSGKTLQSASPTRTERVESKLRLAKTLLGVLPPDSSETRLLRIAMIRRDEVLLDGLLGLLEGNGARGALTAERTPAQSERPAANSEGRLRRYTLLPPAPETFKK
jgi:hypothetical protein